MKKTLAPHNVIMRDEIPNFHTITFSAQTKGYVCMHAPVDTSRAADCIAKLRECKNGTTLKTFCDTWRPLFENNGRRIQPSTLSRWITGTIQPDVITCDCIEAVHELMKSGKARRLA